MLWHLYNLSLLRYTTIRQQLYNIREYNIQLYDATFIAMSFGVCMCVGGGGGMRGWSLRVAYYY